MAVVKRMCITIFNLFNRAIQKTQTHTQGDCKHLQVALTCQLFSARHQTSRLPVTQTLECSFIFLAQ